MAKVSLKVERIVFVIEDHATVCQLFYSSDEPGHPTWGGGWKTKEFSPTLSVQEILNDVSGYIEWDDFIPPIEYVLN